MISSQPFLQRASFLLACGASVAVLFSIAATNILLSLAFAALLMSGEKLRFPPIRLPLALFALGTVVSMLLSPDASAGRPQLRKFFVFLMLLVVYSAVRNVGHVRTLLLCMIGAAGLSALRSLFQFANKMDQAQQLGVNFYTYYVAERTTGFMSHWMTFGGQLMILLLMLGAFLFFSPAARGRKLWPWLGCGALIFAALVLGWTRSIWLGTAAGGLFLLWYWKPRLILTVPVLLAALLWINPGALRQRVLSAARPHGEVDSNQHRIITFRTGWRMIQAHPWFGLGPEHVNLDFKNYLPPDVPLPLPDGWYGHLHNIYLHYAAERGIPTMLALMWLLARILWDFLRTVRKIPGPHSDEKFILRGAAAVILAILVEGVFELNLGDSEVLMLFLVIVAAGYAAVDAVNAKKADEQVPGV